MLKIVFTGGPCGGKSEVLAVLAKQYGSCVIVVPEVARKLLQMLGLKPSQDFEWSPEWQKHFQRSVLPAQRLMEFTYTQHAEKHGTGLLLLDRGILDGAGYTPEGVEAFCRAYEVSQQDALGHYVAVIHLESLATDEQAYLAISDKERFETPEDAKLIDSRLMYAWSRHPLHFVIRGTDHKGEKITRVIEIIAPTLSALQQDHENVAIAVLKNLRDNWE